MRGLFLQYGTCQAEKEADDFLKFCSDAKITDAFIQTDVIGKGSRIDFVPDMFSYIVKNRGKLNIHAHITTLRLWREQKYLKSELRPEIKDEWLYLNPPEHLPLLNADKTKVQRYWCLDPVIPGVQDYLVEKCKRVVKDNDIQGLYLERLYYQPAWGKGKGTEEEKTQVLTDVLTKITSECKKIKPLIVSVAVFSSPPEYLAILQAERPSATLDHRKLTDLSKWETIVDYLMPMIFIKGTKFDIQLNAVKLNPKYITTLGCYQNTLLETQEQLAKVGTNVAFFDYGKLSTDGTKESFKDIVCQISK